MPRKRTFQNDSDTEKNDQLDNERKKKFTINKPQPTKIEYYKPFFTNLKKTKNRVFASKNSTNIDSICDSYETTILKRNSLNNASNNNNYQTHNINNIDNDVIIIDDDVMIIDDDVIIIDDDVIIIDDDDDDDDDNNHINMINHINNANKDVMSKNLGKNYNAISLQPLKVKLAPNNANKKTKPTKLKTNNDLEILKILGKKECAESLTSVKDKSPKNSINKDHSSIMLLKCNNIQSSKTSKKKTSSIKRIPVSNKGNTNDILFTSVEIINDKATSNTNKAITPIQKTYGVNIVNKSGTSEVFEKNCQNQVKKKRGRPPLNKKQQSNSKELAIHHCLTDFELPRKAAKVLNECETQSFSSKFDNNTVMLKINNKPPNIKKKSINKWSENKVSNCLLESNVDNHSGVSTIEVNNYNIQKPLKSQKPKNLSCIKLNTKILDKLKSNPLLLNISKTSDIVKNSTANVLETLNCDAELINNSIPITEPYVFCDNAPVTTASTVISGYQSHRPNTTVLSDVATPLITSTLLSVVPPLPFTTPHSTSTTSPAKFTTLPSTSVSPPSITSNLPSISTILPKKFKEFSNFESCNENCSQSHLITFESMNDFNYEQFAESEISYGVDVQSEAINPQCDESMKIITTPSSSVSPAPIFSTLYSTSTPPSTITNVSNNVYAYQNCSPSNLISFESMNDPNYVPVAESETSHGVNILPEAISLQCDKFMIDINTSPSASVSPTSMFSTLPSTSTLPLTFTDMPEDNENDSQSHFMPFGLLDDSNYMSFAGNEMDYGLDMLFETINPQCYESMNNIITTPPSAFDSPPSIINTGSSTSTSLPIIYTEVPIIVSANENGSQPNFITFGSINDTKCVPVSESVISNDLNILYNEPMNNILTTPPSKPVSPTSMFSTLPSTSTLPLTFTEVPNIVSSKENCSKSPSITLESMNDSSYFPVAESDLSYKLNILSEVINTQCNDSMDNVKTTPSKAVSPSSILSTPPSLSTPQPSTLSTEVFYNVSASENFSQPYLIAFESINNSNEAPIAESEENDHEVVTVSEDIMSDNSSLQCNESLNSIATKSEEKSTIKEKSKQTNSAQVSLQKNKANIPRKEIERMSEIHKQSIESESQSRIDHEIFILSKRFDIPFDTLKKVLVDDSLHFFQSQLSASITPSMLTVSPIIETKIRNEITGSIDVQKRRNHIAKSEAFAKTNLIDVMAALSKMLPSWSLSIVSNPPKYVISQIKLNKNGVPFFSKSIVLDETFNAHVYINHCLEHSYCKRYVNAADIINLILDLNSL